MANKWYAFELESKNCNLLGRKTYRWVITKGFSTKKMVKDTYGRSVKNIYTLEQLLKKYGERRTKEILEETRYSWIREY